MSIAVALILFVIGSLGWFYLGMRYERYRRYKLRVETIKSAKAMEMMMKEEHWKDRDNG